MESQSQNPEFRNNPENFHPCLYYNIQSSIQSLVAMGPPVKHNFNGVSLVGQ